MEKEFVCKLCNKSFSNGRILGGHMRGHNGTKVEKNLNEEIGYILRENPKKSWKFLGSKECISKLENLCAMCGKGFDSPRALFGHMRHHLGRKRKGICCTESGNGNSSGLVKWKRSRRMSMIAPTSSFSGLNESACCEIEQEVEYVAKCLMMLSRGVRNSGEFNSNTFDCLDNNSVSYEVKDVGHSKQIAINENANCVCNVSTSDSGNVLPEVKEIELEFPVEFNKLELDKSGVLMCRTNGNCEELILEPNEIQSRGGLMEGVELDAAGFVCKKFSSSVRDKFEARDPEMGTSYTSRPLEVHDTTHKTVKHASIFPNIEANFILPKLISIKNLIQNEMGGTPATNGELKKSEEHECAICFRVFASGQALGGHKRAHMTKKSETGEQTIALHKEPSPSLPDTLCERDP